LGNKHHINIDCEDIDELRDWVKRDRWGLIAQHDHEMKLSYQRNYRNLKNKIKELELENKELRKNNGLFS